MIVIVLIFNKNNCNYNNVIIVNNNNIDYCYEFQLRIMVLIEIKELNKVCTRQSFFPQNITTPRLAGMVVRREEMRGGRGAGSSGRVASSNFIFSRCQNLENIENLMRRAGQ